MRRLPFDPSRHPGVDNYCSEPLPAVVDRSPIADPIRGNYTLIPLQEPNTMRSTTSAYTDAAPAAPTYKTFTLVAGNGNALRRITVSAEMEKELTKARGSVFLPVTGISPERVAFRSVTVSNELGHKMTFRVLAPVTAKPSELRAGIAARIGIIGPGAYYSGSWE